MIDKVKQIIADQLSIDEREISLDSSFTDDLGADSLDVVELLMAFSEEFDMEISDEEAEQIVTVGDIVEYLKEHE
ncbi:MAG: acyl carrier protein [Clostridia bacterium]|nr:acyl carrier protein [Clostridia bacterium]